MQIAIITVKREPCYLHKTMSDLWRNGAMPVDLFVGTPDLTDVGAYKGLKFSDVHEMPSQLWQTIEHWPVHRRAAANFWRALVDDLDDDLVIFEDDISIKSEWIAHAREFLRRSDVAGAVEILTLYSSQKLAELAQLAKLGRDGFHWAFDASDHIEGFHGTLGLVIPRQIRRTFAAFVGGMIFTKPMRERWPFDECLREFIRRGHAALLVRATSDVDHIGEVSTIPENANSGPRKSPVY